MSGREAQPRFWRLDVYEDNNERIFKIPFVSIDRTLDHLVPELRTIVRDCAIVFDPSQTAVLRLGSLYVNHERS